MPRNYEQQYKCANFDEYRYLTRGRPNPNYDLMFQMLEGGNYRNLVMHRDYTAVWEDFIPRYRLIKVCPAFTAASFEDWTREDLFALESVDDTEIFAVMVGAIFKNWEKKRTIQMTYVIEWRIPKDEEMLIKISI